MDVDTSAAIERLSERIDVLDATVRRGLDDLRAETREGLAESRRHTEVLFESLRDDIRILAEGFATVSLKLDSLQR
jgi:hypothetical protein